MKKIALLSVIAFLGLITNSFAQNTQADLVSGVISNLVANQNAGKSCNPISCALCSLGLDGLTPSSDVKASEDGKTSSYIADNGDAVTITNNGTTNTVAVNVPSGGKLPIGLANSLGGNPTVTKSATGDVKATVVSADGKTNVKVFKDGHIEISKTGDAQCTKH